MVRASYDRTDFTSGVSDAVLIGELNLANPSYGISMKHRSVLGKEFNLADIEGRLAVELA